jgi:hypothetical protein
VHTALSRYAFAQLCERQVVLLMDEMRHQPQRFSVEQGAPPASMRSSGGPAGQSASAQHLLDKGDADAELPSELTPRGRALVAGLGDLGT